MKALVINLKSQTARMNVMSRQLADLGIAFERLPAIEPATLSPPPDDPYWSLWQRPMRTTEMAALASHRAAWAHVAAANAPMLILEDDSVLRADTPNFLSKIEDVSEAELVTLETRGRKKLIAKKCHGAAPMHRLWQDRTGAAAYILRPEGARKLLDHVARAPGLADGMICAAYDVTMWQAVPALACQLDRCEAEGLTPPLSGASSIDSEAKPKSKPSIAQRCRRVGGQARMGLRQLVRALGSERVIVPLKRD